MTLGHEKLDVYRLTIAYVAWVYQKASDLSRLGKRGLGIHENSAEYGFEKDNFDFDGDFDSEKDILGAIKA